MELTSFSPVGLLAQSLEETHGLVFTKNESDMRPDWWTTYFHGSKLELERQKRGQLRLALVISGKRQEALCSTEALGGVKLDRKPWGVVHFADVAEDFIDVIDAIDEAFSESGISKTEKAAPAGATFAGTVFERIQERGATMSGKFGALVCQASGMELTETIAEWTLDNGRQVDGVELDPVTQKPISIYECQSGIHNGQYLDANHRDKALGEYLYDPSILPTARKVVILAGGYSDEDLRIIRERAFELARREQPVEVVLLQTVRMEAEIKVVTVQFAN